MADAAIALSTTVVVSPNQVSTSLGHEAVILGADAGEYFGLNEVGARVWELVQQPVQVSAICAALCDEYEVQAAECERDVIELLAEMRERGLLDVRDASAG
ncbi:MAG TPA: PqqD family protein [Polyangiales bacterium]|nr:PqqD family protein [Polyangiales bacterium]